MHVGFTCPSCSRAIDHFALDVSPTDDCVTLESVCEPCKTIYKFAVSVDELRLLARGNPVEMHSAPTAPLM